ncbi:pseudouridine synthase [Rhodococcoides yunnanense]|uniref:pseudouridine synthase n=1 Tax=Rhodococcoides yunnanense TaxID=278209 RepID=UPI0022B1059C|nr:pseudouridine synthase [Rhodococcus yunnanensis]MCZ4275306.1 pseudouridine synthase [Rhodococcus yunnanensis]
MNKPARRDGTPDRNKRQDPRRKPTTGRSEEPREGRRTGDSPRAGGKPTGPRPPRSAAPRKGAEQRKPFADQSADSGVNDRSNDAVPRKKPSRPKPPKPQKKQAPSTIINNAKPAKHQYIESDTKRRHVPRGEGVRLQKVLAQAGVASRRAAEELIADGRVEVDGRIVTEQGNRIDPDVAIVRVDGTRIVVKEELVHLAMNKPRGWQCTMSDDLGRPCVGDIVSERVQAGQRLFHVGRLDADTEGLLLFTNDGDLAHRLMHPSFEVSKTYLATLFGTIPREVGKQLRSGVVLDDGPVKVDGYSLLDVSEGKSLVRITLHEGRKHIVRRLFEKVGYPVGRLVRTDVGNIALGDQRPGTLRVLGRGEIGKLYESVGL